MWFMSCTPSGSKAGRPKTATCESPREDYSWLSREFGSREAMPSAVKNTPRHVSSTGSNICADLGFAPEEALALKFKSMILAAILAEVRWMKYTQSSLVQELD